MHQHRHTTSKKWKVWLWAYLSRHLHNLHQCDASLCQSPSQRAASSSFTMAASGSQRRIIGSGGNRIKKPGERNKAAVQVIDVADLRKAIFPALDSPWLWKHNLPPWPPRDHVTAPLFGPLCRLSTRLLPVNHSHTRQPVTHTCVRKTTGKGGTKVSERPETQREGGWQLKREQITTNVEKQRKRWQGNYEGKMEEKTQNTSATYISIIFTNV